MKIFSFDAETNGLWGRAFSIAALVYEDGAEVARFIGRCPLDGQPTEFVRDNVLPQMVKIEESHDSYEALIAEFAEFYLANKDGADVIVHMGVPVESRLLSDMHSLGFIGDWDGPYPMIDLAGCLRQVDEDPTSVDAYAVKHGVVVDADDFAGGTHNPLYDSAAAAAVYLHLVGKVVVAHSHYKQNELSGARVYADGEWDCAHPECRAWRMKST